MQMLNKMADKLAVALFGRVSGVREFFELFREAAGHEFILGMEAVLNDWKKNLSSVRYVLEPIYHHLKRLGLNTSADAPGLLRFLSLNMDRFEGVQSRIVAGYEWLNSQENFDESVRDEIVERCREIETALSVWSDRLLWNLGESNEDWSKCLRNIASSREDQDWVCELARAFFPSDIPAAHARFRKVIAEGIPELVDDLNKSIEACKVSCENLHTISDDLESPPMQMCMVARRVYLGALQAIITAEAELTEDTIERIRLAFGNAERVASEAVQHANFERLMLSFKNLHRRFEILQTHLPTLQFEHLALNHV